MRGITPSLWFDGNAEEAMRFYVSIFDDAEVLDVTRQGPDGAAIAVSFRLQGQQFIAINGGPEFPFTEAVSFTIHCESQEEVDSFWEKLTDGGQPHRCGWLKDRYGLSWQVVPDALIEMLGDADPEKAQRVVQAMLQMEKIDVPALRAAYAGAVPA